MRKIDYKWVMLALVSSAYFLAQGTRQIYNSVLPQIKEDFLFLCSENASFITGANHAVDGGRLCMYRPYVPPPRA